MSTILVTGASGFIGRPLVEFLAANHRVIAMSRRRPATEAAIEFVPGEFHSFEDLRRLDSIPIDVVVHLAAVTGGSPERSAMTVNVEGTRCLLRYLVDRGCRKFVLASSIAVPGILSTDFRPIRVPIPDDHPCFAVDAYGLSKHLMEEVAKYFSRQRPELDFINIRLAAICKDTDISPGYKVQPGRIATITTLARMFVSDAVRVFALAADATPKPGVRTLNAMAEKSDVADSIPDILRSWYPGTTLDFSHYERPGHERDAIFDVRRVREELSFVGRPVTTP